MTDTTTIDLLCQRMIEDMTARKLGPASQKPPACLQAICGLAAALT